MKLTVTKREDKSKGATKAIRRAGNIPAVLYSKGEQGESVAVDGAEFARALRTIQKGFLSTTVFDLQREDGSMAKALVKGIEYHPTTYNILHIDLMQLHDNVPVQVKVPIEFTGAVDCVGIKLGGFLRVVIRYLRVLCLPKDLPGKFTLDVKDLNIKQVRRLREIALPEAVRPLQDLNEVAVVIAKR